MNAKDQYFDTIREAAAQTLSATMFLSRLPLGRLAERISVATGTPEFDETARYFGIAAIVVVLPATAVLWISLLLGFSTFASATMFIVALVLTTGALHEDALADVADGFGGGSGRKRKIEIMRDSSVGTYGATSLILAFLLHLAFLVQLILSTDILAMMAIVIAANVASTSSIVWPWANMPPARKDGGLSSNHGIPSQETAKRALIVGFGIGFMLLWFAAGLLPAFFALAACGASVLAFSTYCRSQIGGHTGDTLGATKKISELCLLFALIIAT